MRCKGMVIVMKKALCILCAVLCVAGLVTGTVLAITGAKDYNEAVARRAAYDALTEGENTLFIEVKGYGVITAVLYPDIAPETVANIKKLASESFYDGLIFHRVIEDFMIQGGDPKGNGSGGSAQNIKGEFTANGVNNTLSHKRGVLSMARQGDSEQDHLYYNTASSQFFIVHKDSTFLDGKYASFGEVTSGMEIVDAIAAVPTNYADKPLVNVTMHTVTQDKEKLSIPEQPSVVSSFLPAFIAGGCLLVFAGLSILFFLLDKNEKAAIAARLQAEEQARRQARAEKTAMKKKK